MPVKLASRYKYRAKTLSGAELETTAPALAIAARSDLAAFGEYVCGKVAAAHHRDWFDDLGNPGVLKLSILAPRGSAKSTWLAIFAAWWIGSHPDAQVIYVGYSESVALKQSRIIKRILESDRYRLVFPRVRPGKRWSDTDWEIDKAYAGVTALDSDYTLYAVGATGAITSRRASLIIYDDLIKSSAAIANEEIREKLITNVQEVLQPTLIPGGLERSVGTRFRRDDLHATEFIADNGWVVKEQPAITPDGYSYWGDRFSLEFLQAIQKRNPLIFAFQYQNSIPPQGEDAIIRADWIEYGVVPKVFDELVMGVDLAASEKEKGDYTAFVLAGRVGQQYWIVEAVRERISGNLGKIRRILEFRKRYGDFRTVVERVAYQASFEGDWRDEMKRRRLNLRCEEYIPKGDKDQRLEGISGIFANGLVTLNRDRPMQDLVNELLRLTLEHDDLADGCVIALSRLQRRSRKPLSGA